MVIVRASAGARSRSAKAPVPHSCTRCFCGAGGRSAPSLGSREPQVSRPIGAQCSDGGLGWMERSPPCFAPPTGLPPPKPGLGTAAASHSPAGAGRGCGRGHREGTGSACRASLPAWSRAACREGCAGWAPSLGAQGVQELPPGWDVVPGSGWEALAAQCPTVGAWGGTGGAGEPALNASHRLCAQRGWGAAGAEPVPPVMLV